MPRLKLSIQYCNLNICVGTSSLSCVNQSMPKNKLLRPPNPKLCQPVPPPSRLARPLTARLESLNNACRSPNSVAGALWISLFLRTHSRACFESQLRTGFQPPAPNIFSIPSRCPKPTTATVVVLPSSFIRFFAITCDEKKAPEKKGGCWLAKSKALSSSEQCGVVVHAKLELRQTSIHVFSKYCM